MERSTAYHLIYMNSFDGDQFEGTVTTRAHGQDSWQPWGTIVYESVQPNGYLDHPQGALVELRKRLGVQFDVQFNRYEVEGLVSMFFDVSDSHGMYFEVQVEVMC